MPCRCLDLNVSSPRICVSGEVKLRLLWTTNIGTKSRGCHKECYIFFLTSSIFVWKSKGLSIIAIGSLSIELELHRALHVNIVVVEIGEAFIVYTFASFPLLLLTICQAIQGYFLLLLGWCCAHWVVTRLLYWNKRHTFGRPQGWPLCLLACLLPHLLACHLRRLLAFVWSQQPYWNGCLRSVILMMLPDVNLSIPLPLFSRNP